MPSHGLVGGAPGFPLCHGHSELRALCGLQSSAVGPRDCPGPASSTNSSPDSSLGASPGLGRDGCRGNPEVVLLVERPPGVVVSSVPHNMAPLSPCTRPVPPKRSLWSLLTAPQLSRCSGSQCHEGLPFPHFIASARAVSVFVRVGLRQRHLQTPECGRGVGGACRPAGHAPMSSPRPPLVAMAVRRRCPVPPQLRSGFISVAVARRMGVVTTMGVVTKRGGAAVQAGLAHHPARPGRGS